MRAFNIARASHALCLSFSLGAPMSQAHAAQATPLPPKIQKLDFKSFCPISTGPVSKNLLARAIIDAYQIPQEMVDWNGTGVIVEEDNTRAASTYLCGSATTSRQIDLCEQTDDSGHPTTAYGSPILSPAATTQHQMIQELNLALTTSLRDHPDGQGGFYLQLSKATVHFVRRGAPATPLDVKQKPLLTHSTALLVGEVFSPDYFDISCARKAASATPPPSDNNPAQANAAPTDTSTTASPISAAFDHIRLRATTSDLNIGRDTDAFAGLKSATLAIVNDDIARKNTFDMHLVLGYALPTVQLGSGDTILDSIPFFQYDRDYVDGAKAPPTSSNVNNAILGDQENLTFPITDTFYNNLIFQPEYIWNLRNSAQIAKLHLALQPEPLLPFVGFAAPTGVAGFSATAYARAVFNYGQVTRSTTDPTLALTNNFAQGGIELGGSLFNKDDSSSLNGLSFPIDYTNLYGFTGQYKAIEQLMVGVNYTLPKTKYVTLGFSYTDGRDVDTFEKQKVYKVTLGAKY